MAELNGISKNMQIKINTSIEGQDKVIKAYKDIYKEGKKLISISATEQWDKETQSFKKLGVSISQTTRHMELFNMSFLGLLFFGMQIQKTFSNIIKQSFATFTEISQGANKGTETLAILGAEFKYLQFVIADTLINAIEPFLPAILSMVDIISELIEQNPKLVAGIVLGGVALGTLLFTVGTLYMGISALKGVFATLFTGGFLSAVSNAGVGLSIIGDLFLGIGEIIEGIKNKNLPELALGFLTTGGTIAVGWLLAIGAISVGTALGIAFIIGGLSFLLYNWKTVLLSMVAVGDIMTAGLVASFEWAIAKIESLFTGKDVLGIETYFGNAMNKINNMRMQLLENIGLNGSDFDISKNENFSLKAPLVGDLGAKFSELTAVFTGAKTELDSFSASQDLSNQKLSDAKIKLDELQKSIGTSKDTADTQSAVGSLSAYSDKMTSTAETSISNLKDILASVDALNKTVVTTHIIKTIHQDDGGGSSSSVGSNAFGTGFVPSTGLYTLHQGEMVIPSGTGVNVGGINLTVNANTTASASDIADIVESRILDNLQRYI